MFLRASAPIFSPAGETAKTQIGGVVAPAKVGTGVVCAAAKNANHRPLTGVVFEPFEEVKKELMLVPSVPQDSIARHKYSDDCESVINEQIKYNSLFIRVCVYICVCV